MLANVYPKLEQPLGGDFTRVQPILGLCDPTETTEWLPNSCISTSVATATESQCQILFSNLKRLQLRFPISKRSFKMTIGRHIYLHDVLIMDLTLR